MADVLVQFDTAITDPAGRAYIARVCGRERADGTWEGWIEFDPHDTTPVLRTPRETTQPNRTDLAYWARGLTVTYLEGALSRAQHPTPDLRPPTVDARSSYEGPAPLHDAAAGAAGAAGAAAPRAVLDPFEVYAQGEDVLRDELLALDEGHLRNIIRAYGLAPQDRQASLQSAPRAELTELIIAAVRDRAP